MLQHSPARVSGAVLAVFAALLAGCQSATLNAPLGKDGRVTATYGGDAAFPLAQASAAHAGENAYFPLTPGLTSDFRVTRLGVGVRYVRVTTGEPEMFFGRLATPWVYGDIPGMERDSTLYGLRQYFSENGEPDLFEPGRQLEDWAAAIDHARSLDGVDPARVATFGSSMGGGNALAA